MTTRRWHGPYQPGAMAGIDRRSIISLLRHDNPKKKGQLPRERFAQYRDGMTVDQYIAAVVGIGQREEWALDDLCWDQMPPAFIRVEPPSNMKPWSVADAKAKLSEILRLARAGEPQTIGSEEPCVVISAARVAQLWQPEPLGKFLIESAPRGDDLELPPRSDDRGDPFAVDKSERAA